MSIFIDTESIDYQCLINKSSSKSDFAFKLGHKYHNGRVAGLINRIIKEHNLDISHFRKTGGGINKKYEFVEKECPVCKVKFTTQNGHRDEKFTCSNSCANKFFPRRWKDTDITNYTTICFRHHKKECVVCGEKNIVAVHHFDENDKNNNPENLIPMCPTHHQYWHSRFKFLVEEKVTNYRNEFIRNRV